MLDGGMAHVPPLHLARSRRHLRAVAIAALIFVAACHGGGPATKWGRTVVAELDLLASPPIGPTPSDSARDEASGLLTKLPDPPNATPAQVELYQFLRTLDGY